jgi:predicted kinase
MEAIVFVGLQGAGKSTFYKERFFATHVRISMDLVRTRRRERGLMQACLSLGQRFVIDNTNPTAAERAVYLHAAKEARFRTVGYYFQSKVDDCLRRNASRTARERIPDRGVFGTAARTVVPSFAEGFDALFHVRSVGTEFVVEERVREV